jgi:hypothetical protein
MYRALLIVAVLFSACAPAAPRPTGPVPGDVTEEGTVLWIVNGTAGYGTLRLRAGVVTYRVESNQRERRVIHGTGTVRLYGQTIGGGARGPVRVADVLRLDGRCWVWTVDNTGSTFPVPCESERGAR